MRGADQHDHHCSKERPYRMRPVMSPSIRGGLMTGTHGRNDELKRGDLLSRPAKKEGLLPNPGRWSKGTCVSTTKEWLWPQAEWSKSLAAMPSMPGVSSVMQPRYAPPAHAHGRMLATLDLALTLCAKRPGSNMPTETARVPVGLFRFEALPVGF